MYPRRLQQFRVTLLSFAAAGGSALGGCGSASLIEQPTIDAASADALTDAGCTPSGPAPSRILFIGNSFTFGENVPDQVRELALSAGLHEPTIVMRAIGGQTLQGHRADTGPAGAPARVREGWDVVVLQELSTRPTNSIGPAEQFKLDATWFHDLALEANPATRVYLYETWARHPDHELYPATFANPADMQAQLRFHYDDAANNFIPDHSSSAGPVQVTVARAGDAWEHHLQGASPLRLHGSDNYHQNAQGAYLSALTLFGTIYDRSTAGLTSVALARDEARRLQQAANWATGATRAGVECPTSLAIGDELRVDFGPIATAGWPSHAATRGITGTLTTTGGRSTTVSVATSGFSGDQPNGSLDNDLGLPPTVSQDTLWVGSFDGHEVALPMRAEVVLHGLDTGTYQVTLHASRDSNDEGRGRLTRYAIGGDTRDLEVSDNRTAVSVFENVRPDQHGRIIIEVMVSPAGTARFAYIGSLVLVKTGP